MNKKEGVAKFEILFRNLAGSNEENRDSLFGLVKF